jgi:hypothetical protein
MKPANLLGGKQKEGDITVKFRGTAGHYALLLTNHLSPNESNAELANGASLIAV